MARVVKVRVEAPDGVPEHTVMVVCRQATKLLGDAWTAAMDSAESAKVARDALVSSHVGTVVMDRDEMIRAMADLMTHGAQEGDLGPGVETLTAHVAQTFYGTADMNLARAMIRVDAVAYRASEIIEAAFKTRGLTVDCQARSDGQTVSLTIKAEGASKSLGVGLPWANVYDELRALRSKGVTWRDFAAAMAANVDATMLKESAGDPELKLSSVLVTGQTAVAVCRVHKDGMHQPKPRESGTGMVIACDCGQVA